MAELESGPQVWTGRDMSGHHDWLIEFDTQDRAELERAADTVRSKGIALDEAGRDDFALPRLSAMLAKVREELHKGRGFVLMRGLPLKAYTEDELSALFWGLGTHLGTGVAQSKAGDRLGHVRDIGSRDTRYYTRGGELEFHMDPVDVVGLMCLQGAKSGGESRIISSMNVYNAIARERPDLLENLMRGFHYSRRAYDPDATGVRRYTHDRLPVFYDNTGRMECYYLPVSFRQAAIDGAPYSAKDDEAARFMAEVCNRPEYFLDMAFSEGDIQFLNNRTVLHARTDYVEYDDPAKKRHLLRLWLMMPDWPARPVSLRASEETDRGGGGFSRSAAE